MKTMGILIVGLYSSFAMAATTATKAPPVVRMSEPVQVRPSAPVAPRPGVTAVPTSPTLEQLKAERAAKAQGTTVQAAAVTCSVPAYAAELAQGTEFSARDAEVVLSNTVVQTGNCGPGGVAGFDVAARSNLISSALYVTSKINGKVVGELTAAERAMLAKTWSEGLAEAKNRNTPSTEQVTAASQEVVVQKLARDCQIVNLAGK